MELNKELEKIDALTKQLEDENISLDDSIKKYSEACELIEACVKELSTVKGKVTVLRDKIENMIEETLD
ncbi:MAG: exodeoxyribonuclease VII small subunit [Clostridia bacterium]|nr:exodeoxyribonuclease VII small subunit [Clostridia bacterium]